MKILSVLQFSSARELQAFIRELSIINQSSSPTALLKLSLSSSLRSSPERTASIFIVLYFFCSLRAPVLCIFTLSGKLVSFCNLSFFFVVPSLEHRHSLCLETGLVRTTPDKKLASVPCAARTGLVRATLDQKLASVPCTARTGLVLQHLIKITG